MKWATKKSPASFFIFWKFILWKKNFEHLLAPNGNEEFVLSINKTS